MSTYVPYLRKPNYVPSTLENEISEYNIGLELFCGCARVNYQRGQRYLGKLSEGAKIPGMSGATPWWGQGAKQGKPPAADAFVVLKS